MPPRTPHNTSEAAPHAPHPPTTTPIKPPLTRCRKPLKNS